MFFLNWKIGVWGKRATKISMVFKQNCLPESVHFGKMLWPSVLYFFIKYWPDQLVFSHFIIKSIYQKFNVIKRFYIVFFCIQFSIFERQNYEHEHERFMSKIIKFAV